MDFEQPSNILLELCAPERNPVKREVKEVVVPGAEGIFSVLPGHTALLAELGAGVLISYGVDGREEYFAIHHGIAEVAGNRVLVLTQALEHEEEIDGERAAEARERAEQRLKTRPEGIDLVRAEAALYRSMARINAQTRTGY
ncbi:MAG: ATP synthase F1 subunit epsilon [Candidatus Hydrogenedentes bacterium]|nr:ATP synthase F1 subunit epsilon [Candidatus Hydrogenedentota bacterium]